MNFADAAFDACAAKAKELGRRLNGAEWKQTVQSVYDQFQAEAAAGSKIDKRTQTELFNAMAMACGINPDRKSTRLNSSHVSESRMPSSA